MKDRIALHAEPRKVAVVFLSFTLVSLIISILFLFSINRECIQLNSLLHSDYEYSVKADNPMYKNDYYFFNAGIDFTLSDDSPKSINADIIMQTNNSSYTDDLYWNTSALSVNGVAISNNIAKKYNLNIGDILYSKHIVNDSICDYRIEKIVPEVSNVRTSGNNTNNGIVIMGYDESYISNISHYSLVFTNVSIAKLSENNSLKDIVYRDDEILTILKRILPYFMIFAIVSVASVIAFIAIIKKYVSHYYRRLIMLGTNRKHLNFSYYRLTCGLGAISIVVSFALSLIFVFLVCFSPIKLAVNATMTLIESITLLSASSISNKQLWRK